MARPDDDSYYSNSVAAHPGTFDVVLDFGFELGDASEPRSSGPRVAMSWEHARALTIMLGELADRYEQELGALPDVEKARVRGAAGDDDQ
jgi:hypothetical protein